MQARVYGIPGERVRTTGTLKLLLPLLSAVFVLGVVAGLGLALLPVCKVSAAVFGGLFLVAAGFFLWTAHLCPNRVDAFFKGARGEERTAFALESLPEGFCVFNGLMARKRSFAMSRGDMDHVVAGKSGVFVVETKCWEGEVTCEHGRIWVDGQPPTRDPLAQVLKARDELEAALGEAQETAVKVQAVLCFSGRGFLGRRARVNDVEICHVREVAGVIEKAAESSLTRDEVEVVSDRLARMV